MAHQNSRHSTQYNNQDMNTEYISDCCPSCEYIPQASNAHQQQSSAHAQSQQQNLSRNNSRTHSHIIRDPITNRDISVISRHSNGNSNRDYADAEQGCSCINPSACLCLLTAALLILIGSLSSHAGLFTNLFSSSSSLLSSASLTGNLANERVFKGQFLITRGEPYDPRFEFPDSNHFKDTAKKWTGRLDSLFNGSGASNFISARSNPSMLTKLYKRSEILALERGPKGAGSDDTLIHFNLHFKRIKSSITNNEDGVPKEDPLNSASVYVIVATELLRQKNSASLNSRASSVPGQQTLNDPIFGKGVTIDQASLDIEERRPPIGTHSIVNGGHVSNVPMNSWSKSSFPFFSGRPTHASNNENVGLTNGRTSAGIAQPSWLEPRTRFPGLLEGLKEQVTGPGPRTCSNIQLALCQTSSSSEHARKDFDTTTEYNNDRYIVNGRYDRTTISPSTYSNEVSYNVTSWPNLIGHWNLSSLLDSVLSFRSLIDAECHPRAKEFICRILQPECMLRNTFDANIENRNVNIEDDIEDIAVYPCRDFCTDFWSGCGIFITEFISDSKIRDRMKCSNFPRFDKDPDDDHYSYIEENIHFDTRKKSSDNHSGKKLEKNNVTRKRKEGRRCKNR